jgi:hypothetical protein
MRATKLAYFHPPSWFYLPNIVCFIEAAYLVISSELKKHTRY